MSIDLLGQTINQYEIVELAGEGGLATVYKAYQRDLERWVAIKVLRTRHEEVLARFEQEARVVALLRHPNILAIYDYGQMAGYPYIAMEFVAGGNLEMSLSGKPMDWIKAIRLIIPIAEALHYAHEQDLIHRDIKPSNILMPQPDWPLLADFGLVKVRRLVASLTESDMVIGTPAYMSPEQVNSSPVDPRADIYSLGVLLFELVTGRLPFEHKNFNLLMLAHLSEEPPPPRRLNPACPPELEQIILTALQKSAGDRYVDMQAMLDALYKVMGASTSPISMPSETNSSLSHLSRVSMTSPMQTQPGRNGHGKPARSAARILLPDNNNITLNLPEPAGEGLVIGRSHGQHRADINLGPYGAIEAGISRRHAHMSRSDNIWLLNDLGSLNGTYLNEIKLTPGVPVQLKNGDIIRCGRITFIFLVSPTLSEPEPDSVKLPVAQI